MRASRFGHSGLNTQVFGRPTQPFFFKTCLEARYGPLASASICEAPSIAPTVPPRKHARPPVALDGPGWPIAPPSNG